MRDKKLNKEKKEAIDEKESKKNEKFKEEEEKEVEEIAKEKEEKKKLEEKAKLADEYLSKLQWLQADFENYKKRMEKEKESWKKYSNESLIKNLLIVLDSFEQALASIPKNSPIMNGLKIIFKQFWEILEGEGLKPIKAVGEKFDPFLHEALMIVERDDKKENTIIEELQKGYMLHSKVIRPSKVMVTKKPSEAREVKDEKK